MRLSLDIVNSSCDISEMLDARGFIRVILPRYPASGQLKAMRAAKIEWIVQQGAPVRADEGSDVKPGTLQDVMRMHAPRRLIAVQHLFLLADPIAKAKRGGTRADFWEAFDYFEEKGCILWELSTDLRSDKPKERDAMTREAIEALARGRHKTRRSDKRGRAPKHFTAEQWAAGKARWDSRHIPTWQRVQKGLPKGMTTRDLWIKYGPRDVDETEPD